MNYERPSTEGGSGSADSLYGESNHVTGEFSDERKLYGEPRHEVRGQYDEQTLYGEPQHEIRDEGRELPDLELLFARLRAESATGPEVLPNQLRTSTVRTTEQ